jgi:hypothetical protein
MLLNPPTYRPTVYAAVRACYIFMTREHCSPNVPPQEPHGAEPTRAKVLQVYRVKLQVPMGLSG